MPGPSALIVALVNMLLLPQARCDCKQAAGFGCHASYPLTDSPGPSRTQSTVVAVLCIYVTPSQHWVLALIDIPKLPRTEISSVNNRDAMIG